MRSATLWRALLGVEKTVIESIEFDEDQGVVIASGTGAQSEGTGSMRGLRGRQSGEDAFAGVGLFCQG